MRIESHEGLIWRRYGEAKCPVVLLLHPIATNGSVWSHQADAWAQDFHVIAPDLPGHGASPCLGGSPDMADYAQAIVRSLRAGQVNEPVATVGLSIGSMIAQRLAVDHPTVIRSAVLANGACWTPDEVRQAWQGRIDDARSGGMAALREAMLRRWFTPEFLTRNPEERAKIGGMIEATPITGFVEAAEAIGALDNRSDLARIACPTLVVAGSRDAAAPVAAVQPIAEAISGARYLELAAPHLAHVEEADVFTREIGAFLRGTLPEAA